MSDPSLHQKVGRRDRPPKMWESLAMFISSLAFMAGAFFIAIVPQLRLADRPKYGAPISTVENYYDHTHYNYVLVHFSVGMAATFAFAAFAVLLPKHMAALSDRGTWHWLPRRIFRLGALIVFIWGCVVAFGELTLIFAAPVNQFVGPANWLVHQSVVIPAVGASLTILAVTLTLWRWDRASYTMVLVFFLLGGLLWLLVIVWHPLLLAYALWVPTISLSLGATVQRMNNSQDEAAAGRH